MTRKEAIKYLKYLKIIGFSENKINEIIKALEQEPCGDAISRQTVLDMMQMKMCGKELYKVVYDLPSVTPTHKWILVSERLPKEFEFVNCTCHSLIDDREDWVVETVYIPQPQISPYSDWGNIPMLNSGDCEVVAWMHRDIPKPYKSESEVDNG